MIGTKNAEDIATKHLDRCHYPGGQRQTDKTAQHQLGLTQLPSVRETNVTSYLHKLRRTSADAESEVAK